MRRADRLFQIIQILRRSKGPVTAEAIAEELETSKRSVYRDIAALMGQRVPIRGEAGLGYVLESGFDLPPLMLTSDEIEAAPGVAFCALRGTATDPAFPPSQRAAQSPAQTPAATPAPAQGTPATPAPATPAPAPATPSRSTRTASPCPRRSAAPIWPGWTACSSATWRTRSAGWSRPWTEAGLQPRGMAMYVVSRNSSMPTRPPSLPRPEALMPPNGAVGSF